MFSDRLSVQSLAAETTALNSKKTRCGLVWSQQVNVNDREAIKECAGFHTINIDIKKQKCFHNNSDLFIICYGFGVT